MRNAVDGGAVFGKPYDFVGTKTFGSVAGYESYANQFKYDITVPGCNTPGRVFVGQRDEPFAVNLGKVFDLVNLVPVDGTAFPGGIMQSAANDIISDKNITTLALELPASCLKGSGNGVIGAWTSASLRQARILNPRPDVRQAGSERRCVDAGVAPVESARQRSGDRPAGQGSLQRKRAEGRRPVRDLRDQPDAACTARRAVP